MTDETWEKIFWIDGFKKGDVAQGGMFYRSMGLGKFIRDLPMKGYVPVGIRFDSSNNCEILFRPPANLEKRGMGEHQRDSEPDGN